MLDTTMLLARHVAATGFSEADAQRIATAAVTAWDGYDPAHRAEIGARSDVIAEAIDAVYPHLHGDWLAGIIAALDGLMAQARFAASR